MPPFIPTEEQEEILRHDLSQNARILAGPGTGKSATVIVMLNREQEGDRPLRAKLLTFTRAATAELAHRLAQDEAPICERPSTVHSFCMSILLSNPGLGEFPRPIRMADDWEEDALVETTLARRLAIKKVEVQKLFLELAANWESLASDPSPAINEDVRARFLGGWREHREILGYTLPAELPYALRAALEVHPELRGIDYDILVVDEYQDLNACDLEVLRHLEARGIVVIAAGDDDQSIYSFRKADPEGIRRFPADYPGAADYTLSITQRCGKNIVQWANHVIQQDPARPAGRRLRASRTAPDGTTALLSFRSDVAEARGVAALARHLIANREVPPAEVLILLRSDHNGQFSRRIKEELDAIGIEFSDPSVVNEIMSQDETRRALSILRIAAYRDDSLAWAALLNLEPGVGSSFFDYVYERARRARSNFGQALLAAHEDGFVDGPRSSGRAATLVETVIRLVEALPAPDQMPETGWSDWISDTWSAEMGVPLSDEFRELLAEVDARIENTDDLGRYLGQIWPLARDNALARSAGVRIMTLAGSKGLTVEAAILVGLEAGLVPKDGCDRAEEGRLLYVGMTRAKKYLFGTWARRRTGPTARAGRARPNQFLEMSPFLDGGRVRSKDGAEYLARLGANG